VARPIKQRIAAGAISEQGQNFLLNPAHPDAVNVTVAEIFRAPFDARLLK